MQFLLFQVPLWWLSVLKLSVTHISGRGPALTSATGNEMSRRHAWAIASTLLLGVLTKSKQVQAESRRAAQPCRCRHRNCGLHSYSHSTLDAFCTTLKALSVPYDLPLQPKA